MCYWMRIYLKVSNNDLQFSLFFSSSLVECDEPCFWLQPVLTSKRYHIFLLPNQVQNVIWLSQSFPAFRRRHGFHTCYWLHFTRVCHRLHDFPRLPSVAYFPRLTTVTRFASLVIGCHWLPVSLPFSPYFVYLRFLRLTLPRIRVA